MTTYRHFLLIYDQTVGALLEEPQEFNSAVDATEAYEAAERRHEGNDDRVEVVLVASDSLDTVKRTHANFFGDVTLEFWQMMEQRFPELRATGRT